MKFSEFQQEVRTRSKLKHNGRPTNAEKLQEAFTLLLEQHSALSKRVAELEELMKAPWQGATTEAAESS